MAYSSSSMTYRPISNFEQSETITDNEPKFPIPNPKITVKCEISVSCPINLKTHSTPVAVAERISRNLGYFHLIYMAFIMLVLIITLIPRRKFSLLLLLVNTNFIAMHLLLLRAFPTSVLVHRWLDKRVVLGLIVLATVVEMIVTKAGFHLLLTLVGTLPIILVHATLHATEGLTGSDDQDEQHNLDAAV